MAQRRKGTIHPVTVFALAVIVAALLVAMAGTALFRGVAKRAEERKAEKESAKDFIAEAKKLAEGGELGRTPDFPDTSIGRMQRLSFEWLRDQQKEASDLLSGLKQIGWDWVGTPDSLRTKANLERCLAITPQAKERVRAHRKQLDASFERMMRDLASQGDSSRESQEFLAGIRLATQDSESGYRLGLRTWETLIKNIEALEEMFRFLLSRVGRYRVMEDGAIDFDPTVPMAERVAYEAIVDRVNGHMEEMNRLEAKRLEMAKRKFEGAAKTLGN